MHVWKPIVATSVLACVAGVVLLLGYTVAQHRSHGVQQIPVVRQSRPTSQVASGGIDYVGYWCDSANAPRQVMGHDGMDELQVVSFDGTHLRFTVMHTGGAPAYRITSSEDTVTARVANGVAKAEFRDDQSGMASATIELLGDRLLVRIDPLSPSDGGSLRMNIMMVRDEHHSSREVDESTLPATAQGVQPTYYTPVPGSPERRTLMDAARKTFSTEAQPVFVVHELYVQGDWAVGTLAPDGTNVNGIYVWKKAAGNWRCLQGCGDIGDQSRSEQLAAIRRLGVPANLVAAIQFK
jgi:hypothetical protein